MTFNVSENLEQVIQNKSVSARLKRFWASLAVPIFTLLLGLVIIHCQLRVEENWAAKSGVIYLLGIFAGSLVLSQLLYPILNNFCCQYKAAEYKIYSKDIISRACITHFFIRYVGIFRDGSSRSGPFVLSE